MLLSMIIVPLVLALWIAARPAEGARLWAMIGTLVPLAISVYALAVFNWSDAAAIQFERTWEWLPDFGLNLSLGVDSVSLFLIALTTLLGPICVACSFTSIQSRVRTYYAWLLVLQAAMVGVFAARDLVVFYICFEFTLAPMWVLINLFGSSNRKRAATKFFLYTFTGSLFTLAGLLYVVWHNTTLEPGTFLGAGEWSFDIGTLQNAAAYIPASTQGIILLALMLGFAVKVPLFPLHTWLPLAHTEAPTAGSVILAGVLLKLGTYGIYRFVLPMAPLGVIEHAELLAILSIIGIIYAGLICWVQEDVKRLVAYSSVSHLGFCVLGLVALNSVGVSGSVLYMINHGLSTGALFLLIGMVYERYHTRSMKELRGLASTMPVWSSFMVFFVMASVGLPGLNGFVGEFMCLVGTFQAGAQFAGDPGAAGAGMTLGPWFAAFAGTGMIVAAIYLLYMVGVVVWGTRPEGSDEKHHDGPLPRDLNAREIATLAPLAVLCVVLGVYPAPLLRGLEAPVLDTIAKVEAAREIGGRRSPGPLPSPMAEDEVHASIESEESEGVRGAPVAVAGGSMPGLEGGAE